MAAPNKNRIEERNKHHHARSLHVSDGIAALAEKIGVQENETHMTIAGVDPDALVNSFGFGDLMMFQNSPEEVVEEDDTI